MLWWEDGNGKELVAEPATLSAAVAGTALKLTATDAGLYSQLGWYKANTGFSSVKGYTVEFRAKVLSAAPGGFSVYGFDATGKGFRLELSNNLLTEHANVLLSPDTLSTAPATDDFHTYRVTVAPDDSVRVWRDNAQLATLPVRQFKGDNLIVDGGFENGQDAAAHGWTHKEGSPEGEVSVSSDPAHVRSGRYGLLFNKGGGFINGFFPMKYAATYDVSFYGKVIDYPASAWRDLKAWIDPDFGDPINSFILNGSNAGWQSFTGSVATGGQPQSMVLETVVNAEVNQNIAAYDDFLFTERIEPSRIPAGAVNLFPNGDFEDPDYDYFPAGDLRNDTPIVSGCDKDNCPNWHPFWGARVRLQDKRQGGRDGESGNWWARSGTHSLRYFNCFGEKNATEYGVDKPEAEAGRTGDNDRGSNTNLQSVPIELEIGKTYTLSFWYHFSKWPGDHLKVHVKNGNDTIWFKDINNADFPRWINIIKTFTATETNHAVSFTTEYSGTAPGVFYMDDIFLFEGEPLPAYNSTYLFFGKPVGRQAADVEIESISYDNTGAYSPTGETVVDAYKKKEAQLMTPWGEALTATDPILNEYPRPQLQRSSWVNLNGIWSFTRNETKAGFGVYNAGEVYRKEILVPYPVESALSGIMDTDYANMNKTYTYRRTFTVDPATAGKRIILHFGAVDWESYVFVNGTQVAHHVGGYDPFSADITDALTASGEQELVVQVYDPTKGGNPRGKQDPIPGGIWYTPSSGIWQTVWYEAVDPTYVKGLSVTPDVDNSAVKIRVDVENAGGATVEVTIKDGDVAIGAPQTIAAGEEVSVAVSNPKLWSPDTPFLYGLEIAVKKAGSEVDHASGYFGMRKVSLGKLRGKPYMFLNNEPIFHYGTLDQGYWPDGLHTAPTYEALRFDLEETKKLGLNMVRKHIKVEPARWYYYCDSIGLMVWQDMPTPAGLLSTIAVGDGTEAAVKENFLRETEAVVKALKNYPSIVMWVPYNEGWGQFAGSDDPAKGDASHTINGVNLIRSLDNTRLINPASGWTSYEVGDILDRHNYSEPALHNNVYNERASVCGETGGYGYAVAGHIWNKTANPYVSITSPEALAEKYSLFNSKAYLLTLDGINGIVYTQFSDVEEEVNGFFTYDRRVNKLALNDGVAGKVLKDGIAWMKAHVLSPLLKKSSQGGETWKYLEGNAITPATGWESDVAFDDSDWQEGLSGFGDTETTRWISNDIYLRKIVNIPALEAGDSLIFSIFHDEDFQLYINGVQAATGTGYLTDYKTISITDEAKAAIKWGEDNLFAIHVSQTTGGQKIDLSVFASSINRPLNYEPAPEPAPVWIEVSTVEQFKAIRNNLSGFYKLTADIDLVNESIFEPIGSAANPFRGYLNGNGKRIGSPYIDGGSVSRKTDLGVFGYAVGAHFTDLILDEWAGVSEGTVDVGMLLGRGKGVTIERVAVVGATVMGTDHVGGLVGKLEAGKASYIKNCYVANSTVLSSAYQAGGLAGVARDTHFENCYFSGTVEVPATADNRDGSGIVSRVESGINRLYGIVSLATSVTGGSANEFISRGSDGTRPIAFVNCYARNDMTLSDYVNPTMANLLPRATDAQKRPLEDFQSQALYESIGWDFNHVWKIPEGGGFPVFKCLGCPGSNIPAIPANGTSGVKVYASAGTVTIEAAQPAAVWIYTLSGALVERLDVESTAQVALPHGIYIVKSVSDGKVNAVKVVN
jgi:hypothetical protein